jgi:nucleotide-binding universal stress UspA family protein
MYPNILVPIDGSETSTRGLEEAIQVAKDQDSRLRLFHIVNEHAMDTGYCIGTYAGDVNDRLRANGTQVLRAAEELVRKQGVVVETVVQEFIGRSAAAAILEQARTWPADLIVMGTHGRRGLRRLAMGSDAECVVRDASVPVLLVRALS